MSINKTENWLEIYLDWYGDKYANKIFRIIDLSRIELIEISYGSVLQSGMPLCNSGGLIMFCF